jgi:hypothetical protein
MKIKFQYLFALMFVCFGNYAKAGTLKETYLDQKNNVHVITSKGQHQQISHKGNARRPKLAHDGETVAWLVTNAWTAEGDIKPGSEELVIYRGGKTASIKCTPFIRDYWFWQNGEKIAIDCGGRHFAGRDILYDTRTLKELATFDQAEVPLEKRPDWSNGDD